MEAVLAEHMMTPEAQDGLVLATAITREKHAALLYFEACASGCHRQIVADVIRHATGCEVQHL